MLSLTALPGHEFWPDDISLPDDKRIDSSRLLDSSQIADTYLLALASARRGKMATFDRGLVADAVIGGRQSLHLIAYLLASLFIALTGCGASRVASR